MARFPIVLFDFDGTLVESGPGIIKAMELMLNELGYAPLPEAELRKFVGPPLQESFHRVLGCEGEKLTEAIALYRRLYDEVGTHSLRPFVGIKEMLASLASAGVRAAVATCKVEQTALEQAEKLGILSLLDQVAGLDLSKGRASKQDVLAELLRRYEIRPTDTVLVGDRLYDGEGAKAVGIPFVAALYGYGDRPELAAYDPIAYVSSPAALAAYLLGQ